MKSRLFKIGRNTDSLHIRELIRIGVLEYFPEKDVYIKCEFCEGKGSATQTGTSGPVFYKCFDCDGKGYIPYSDLV